MYISLASLFDHCTQGGTGDGGDTPPSLGRRSIIDNADASSVSTALSKLRDSRGEAVPVLEVVHEVGDLSTLHMVSTSIKLVSSGCEGGRDAVERGVVEAMDLLDECVITPIVGGEEGEEPGSCGLRGALSIVRMEEEFDNVGGLLWLPPCQ